MAAPRRAPRRHPDPASIPALLLALAVASGGCGTAPPTSSPAGPSPTPGPTASERDSPTPASPAPAATPRVGLAWAEVADADLAVESATGSMHGVIAGGPGAVAWGYLAGAGSPGGTPVRGPRIWTSPDGRTWSAAAVEAPADPDPDSGERGEVLDVAVVGPNLVAVGTYLRAERGLTALVWTSRNGAAWRLVPAQDSLEGVRLGRLVPWRGELLAYGCHLASALDCGREGVWSSPDGVAWTEEALVLPGGARSVGIVAAGPDRLWGTGLGATGEPGYLEPVAPSRIASRDGRTWTAAPLPVVGIERFHPLGELAFVTVAEVPDDPEAEAPPAWVSRTGGIRRSADYATWGAPVAATAGAHEIVAVGSTLVAVGTTGSGCWRPGTCRAAAWRSVDGGRTWNDVPVSPVPGSAEAGAVILAVAVLPDGTLVAVGRRTDREGAPSLAAWFSPPASG